MYKFRSMCVDAEAKLAELQELNEKSGPVFKIADDPRITRVGKWIRKLSLDEMPQFFNVLVWSDTPFFLLVHDTKQLMTSEVCSTQSGNWVMNMTVAVNDRRRSSAGEWEDIPSFVDVTMFGNRVQALAKHLPQCAKVAIEGKLLWSQ